MDFLTNDNMARHFCSVCHSRRNPVELVGLVKQVEDCYKKGIINEKTYHEVVRYIISTYVANEVQRKVFSRVNKTLSEKLSPHKFVEALL